MTGRLYGVGLGPGDPELITRKAARLIGTADVVAYHSGTHGRSIARSIAAELLPPGVHEEPLVYPVTTGSTTHPRGYRGAVDDFYDESADRLAVHLAAGRTVVVLCEGDPMFYGSFMYLHDRLALRYPTEVVPGVTSVAAATAAAAMPLVRQQDVLTVLPGTLPVPELARRLADTQGAAIMKLGRTFPAVREALRQAGRLEEALYVERASTAGQTLVPVKDVDAETVPYFSIVIVPGDGVDRGVDRGAERGAERGVAPGAGPAPVAGPASGAEAAELLVVGLGPGPDGWVSPEVTAALAGVDHVVGYAPYVNRVAQREGLQRHASGNTVELERAAAALRLAAAGERVAVVSGGDAGVFGMAAAVFEAAEAPEFAGVPIRVLPGITAAQAVAARAGAPLGGDYAVISLSDRLKPWTVIEDRLRHIARADLALAVYNPSSRSRGSQLADALAVLRSERDPDTVVVVGRDVGRDAEVLHCTTLGELDPATVDMRCLLLIGARGTRVGAGGRVWTPRSVPAGTTSPPRAPVEGRDGA